jgi:4-alpha-glucanotransferase
LNERGSGVLLHITSLPSPYGVGDLGQSAYEFADSLAAAHQSYWQILPLCPTAPIYGNSPYSSISTYAGNTLLVSPEMLLRDGFLTPADIDTRPSFEEGWCDYDGAASFKERILQAAYETFIRSGSDREEFIRFCEKHRSWLDTYALFVVIRRLQAGKSWGDWDGGLRDRKADDLERVRREHKSDVDRVKFSQFIFFSQWFALKDYCNRKGIRIIGDVPIYVSFDSADVWSNPSIFKLDSEKKPVVVAGVPPDYFSATGQLWGNPVYDWDVLQSLGYGWWIERLRHMLTLYDVVRIDHFRGLVAYWEVPAREKTAINGRWTEAPVGDFLERFSRSFPTLPLIAEDLGTITPDVRETMDRFGLPGMKVLLFAFGEDNPMHIYLPHTYERNCVVYTGTHDNNSVRGWFDHEATLESKERLFRYIGREVGADNVNWELIRLAMMSIANTAVTPIQDILGLGEEGRMNRPSVAAGNWGWRLGPSQFTGNVAERLKIMTETYGRAGT